MYYPIPDGSVEIIENCGYQYECQIPPKGYGKHRLTGEVKYVGVRSVSTRKSEQIWKPLELPKDYHEKEKKEKQRQKTDDGYYDAELEKIRNKFWLHRLCGEWVMINGVETYIPPSFWVYLTCNPLDVGLPVYRNTDRKLYYVWEYCCEDPRCAGLVDVERRRMGKTYKSGSILLDRASIYPHHHAGIQSKTSSDAKQVFLKTVVNFFKKYPSFFRPVYDQSKGVTPTSELRFFQTVVKGKRAEQVLEGEELESWIDWGSSDIFYYDGAKLNTYVMDEFGKTMEVDVWDRWNVVRYCLDQDGEWCGKALLTSTIEDMESGGSAAKKIWDASNPNDRDENGRTKSGLYRFFLPAFETTYFDKYGMPEIEKAKTYYLNQRKGLENDPHALSSIIRKNPFSIEEAFRIDGEKCLFNSMKLNERLDLLSWNKSVVERGNFVWEKGEKDTKVKWEKNAHGRWRICWMFEGEGESNRVEKKGNSFYPLNSFKFISGCDPYDHDTTVDSRRSQAASFVLKKNNPFSEDSYNKSFVSMYFARPDTAALFYEDMIKQCVFFGCQILFENNKPGIGRYFKERGYEKFLVKLPDYNDYGIPSTPANKQTLAELTEDYIENNIEKVFYTELIQQWLEFEIKATEKYDLAMAAGWCLVADMAALVKKKTSELREITDYFKMRKHLG